MKTKSILILMLMIFAFAQLNAQELPPKHRGMHPQLKADGKVYDENGKQLGYITKDGKVCDVTGKVIGIIAKTGDVILSCLRDSIKENFRIAKVDLARTKNFEGLTYQGCVRKRNSFAFKQMVQDLIDLSRVLLFAEHPGEFQYNRRCD